jgi:hypothetical protein
LICKSVSVHLTMESKKEKTLICFDANNWLDCIFWNNNADLQFNNNPWEGLQYSDQTVGKFVSAARSSNYELVVVASGGAGSREVRETYEWRREQEIQDEKRGVCLGATLFLQESFEKQGVRVVRPIDTDANDVLAALADTANEFKSAVVVSRNRRFFSYNRAISVCRGFTVRGGKLILERTVTRDDVWCPMRNSLTVQPHLALVAMSDEEKWSQQGHATVYRPSLRAEFRIERGTTSSSDKRMGNLHTLARPLRAAVYAILGEHSALERIPCWNEDDQMVVWTETKVVADPTLSSVLKDPLSVVEWLVERDTPVQQVEPWRGAERMFNICALAAELVAASSQGAWTMLKCMDLFSKDADIIKRTTGHCVPSSPPGSMIVKREAAGPGTTSSSKTKDKSEALTQGTAPRVRSVRFHIQQFLVRM